MSKLEEFTIEQLCKFMSQGKLVAGKCAKCGKLHFPPRPMCDNCFSKEFKWFEVSPNGKLLTYTIIHVAPSKFQSMAPYAVGIVEFDGNLKIPGMIRDVTPEQIKIGMPLTIGFESCPSAAGEWPQWPRYRFKRA